jgi:hypothetical protein
VSDTQCGAFRIVSGEAAQNQTELAKKDGDVDMVLIQIVYMCLLRKGQGRDSMRATEEEGIGMVGLDGGRFDIRSA